MKLAELRNKKVLILGYGREGKATEAYLKAKLPECIVGVADKIFDKDYLNKQKDYDIAIKTPGIPRSFISIPYTTATNIFFGNVNAYTIGVTGSKGKSTTSSLIHHILQTAGRRTHLVGNIGNPMLNEALEPYDKEDIFVCELSSYQTEDLQYSPHISVITSLFPEHMNYHGDIPTYYEAKKRIFSHSTADDYLIYNPNYDALKKWAENAICKAVPYDNTFSLGEVSLLGEHNRENARGAATVARILGISDDIIRDAISTFKPLPHRLEKVGEYRGIMFYDDAISTAPESTISAIESLPQIGTLILGGEDRGYDFKTLVKVIATHQIPNLVFFPTSGETIAKLITERTDYKPQLFHTNSMEQAVRFSYNNTAAGKICLLSTASPSYTLWKNFEDKGNEFQKWVKTLSEKK